MGVLLIRRAGKKPKLRITMPKPRPEPKPTHHSCRLCGENEIREAWEHYGHPDICHTCRRVEHVRPQGFPYTTTTYQDRHNLADAKMLIRIIERS